MRLHLWLKSYCPLTIAGVGGFFFGGFTADRLPPHTHALTISKTQTQQVIKKKKNVKKGEEGSMGTGKWVGYDGDTMYVCMYKIVKQ